MCILSLYDAIKQSRKQPAMLSQIITAMTPNALRLLVPIRRSTAVELVVVRVQGRVDSLGREAPAAEEVPECLVCCPGCVLLYDNREKIQNESMRKGNGKGRTGIMWPARLTST